MYIYNFKMCFKKNCIKNIFLLKLCSVKFIYILLNMQICVFVFKLSPKAIDHSWILSYLKQHEKGHT